MASSALDNWNKRSHTAVVSVVTPFTLGGLSRFLPVTARGSTPLLPISERCPILGKDHVVFLRSSTDGLWAAAMDMRVQFSVWTRFLSLGKYLGVGCSNLCSLDVLTF